MPNDSNTLDNNMCIQTLNTQQEKANHYYYLRDFRVEPCSLFKQHQCQQHRPYSCFNWHFANQRRRRPMRKKDFTFNYSADVYCTKYDENSGVCPDGDDCPYLHRVYGDVERKYHLRYYKTALCVHAVDAKGACAKNGQHCAFAHGPDDLRSPIFDIRELQQSSETLSTIEGMERDRLNFVVEDPIWQDQDYVLAKYKTELCKKPPRLCRQGYACPYYHNAKDQRRAPSAAANKYRSTPCPSVKHGDDWGEPETCDAGLHCQYCHTRTEQQFHPEIYKSTRCNDMHQHGYCPRGPFCAFAHTESEMHSDRPGKDGCSKKLSTAMSPTATATPGAGAGGSPPLSTTSSSSTTGSNGTKKSGAKRMSFSASPNNVANGKHKIATTTSSSSLKHKASLADEFTFSTTINSSTDQNNNNNGSGAGKATVPSYSAVLKQRHRSESGPREIFANKSAATLMSKNAPGAEMLTPLIASSSLGDQHNISIYSKAPGFEREQQSPIRTWSMGSDSVSSAVPVIGSLSKLKTNLFSTTFEMGGQIGTVPSNNTPPTPNSAGPRAGNGGGGGSFSPFGSFTASAASWSTQNVIVPSEESLLDDLLMSAADRHESNENLLPFSPSALFSSSLPVSMSGVENLLSKLTGSSKALYTNTNNNNINNSNQNIMTSSPLLATPFSGGGGGMKTSPPSYFDFPSPSDNPPNRTGSSIGQTSFNTAPDMTTNTNKNSGGTNNDSAFSCGYLLVNELNKTRDELQTFRIRSNSLEGTLKQMRHEYDQLKRKIDEQQHKELVLEQEKLQAMQERDTTMAQLSLLKNELQRWQLNGIPALNADLMGTSQLEQVYAKLRSEMAKVEHVFQMRAAISSGPMCARCGRLVNGGTGHGGCPACSKNPALVT